MGADSSATDIKSSQALTRFKVKTFRRNRERCSGQQQVSKPLSLFIVTIISD